MTGFLYSGVDPDDPFGSIARGEATSLGEVQGNPTFPPVDWDLVRIRAEIARQISESLGIPILVATQGEPIPPGDYRGAALVAMNLHARRVEFRKQVTQVQLDRVLRWLLLSDRDRRALERVRLRMRRVRTRRAKVLRRSSGRSRI